MSQVVLLKKGSGEFNALSVDETIALNRGTARRFILVVSTNEELKTPTLGGVPLRKAWDGSTSFAETDDGGGLYDTLHVYDLTDRELPADGPADLHIEKLLLVGTARVMYAWYFLDQCNQDQPLKAAEAALDTGEYNSPLSVSHGAATEDDFTLCVLETREDLLSATAPFEATTITQSGTTRELGVGHHIGLLAAGSCDWSFALNPSNHHRRATIQVAGVNPDPFRRNTRHVPEARARVTGQLWGKPRFNALLRSYIRRVQEVEDALWDLMEAYDPRLATGRHLDKIGLLVGQPRFGFDDETYRRVIFGRIRAARSRGRFDDLLEIVQLVCDLRGNETQSATGVGNATVLLQISRALTVEEVEALSYLLPLARAAGVQLHLSAPAASFAVSGSSGYLFSGGAESGDLAHDVRRL